MPRLAPLCLAALFALGASLLVRQTPQRRRQAPSPPAPAPEAAAPVERRLSPEDRARVIAAWPAFTPYVSARKQ